MKFISSLEQQYLWKTGLSERSLILDMSSVQNHNCVEIVPTFFLQVRQHLCICYILMHLFYQLRIWILFINGWRRGQVKQLSESREIITLDSLEWLGSRKMSLGLKNMHSICEMKFGFEEKSILFFVFSYSVLKINFVPLCTGTFIFWI